MVELIRDKNQAFYEIIEAYKKLSIGSHHKATTSRWKNDFFRGCKALSLDHRQVMDLLDELTSISEPDL